MFTINKALSGVDIISQTCNHFSKHFEIDTIRLFIGYETQDYDIDFLIKLTDAECQREFYKGHYKSFSIIIHDAGITISGSLSNFYVGKTGILHFELVEPAIIKLGNELQLDLLKARLYRVDINWNIITSRPVKLYNKTLFLDLPRFKRLEQVDGVRFETKQKTLVIYNKTLHLKSKGKVRSNVPDNWLRVEFRIMKNVRRNAKLTYVEDLLKPEKFLNLLNIFMDYFFKVERKYSTITQLGDLKSGKDYLELLMLQGCESRGGLEKVFQEVNDLMTEGILKSRQKKYALRKKIKELQRFSITTRKNRLIEELDTKFLCDFNLIKDLLLNKQNVEKTSF